MKLSIFFWWLLIIGCSGQPKLPEEIIVSKAQKEIQNLVDSFKTEYIIAQTESKKDSTINKFNPKFFRLLSEIHIDSVRVHVDSVIINGNTITTKFHANKDIAFQYGLTFQEPMTPTWDSIFHFMRDLKAGTDTAISFSYMGSHQLSDPSNISVPTLRIFAFPVPRFSNKH